MVTFVVNAVAAGPCAEAHLICITQQYDISFDFLNLGV